MPDLSSVLAEAGLAGRALIAVSFLLWLCVYLRAERLRSMRSGASDASWLRKVAGYSEPDSTNRLQHVGWLQRRALDRAAFLRSSLRTLVAVAPLLGLLGTVAGMVEMFESLHANASGFAEESSLAGGVSQALISTQMGLLVAIPGLVASRLLARREVRVAQRVRTVSEQVRKQVGA